MDALFLTFNYGFGAWLGLGRSFWLKISGFVFVCVFSLTAEFGDQKG